MLNKLLNSWQVILLIAISIGVRVFIFQKMSPGIHNDSITYLFLGELDTIRTPGYPLFIELVLSINDLFSISSDYFRVLCFVQLFVLGVLNCYLIYRISKYLTKSGLFSLAMGIIYSFNYFVVGFEFQVLTETLSITLLLGVIFFYLQIFEGKKYRGIIAGGLAALLLLTRPIFMLAGVFLPLVSAIGFFPLSKRRDFYRKHGRSLVVFFLLSAVALFGWCFRNKVRFNYFGLSSLMPYQLRYYTNSFFDDYKKSGNETVDKVAAIYAEELNRSRKKIDAVNRLHTRGKKELNLSEAEIAAAFMKVNLRLIMDNPGKYLAQVPSSASAYYKNYAAYWTSGNIRKFINRKRFIPRINRFFFRFYRSLFTNTLYLYVILLILPLILLFIVRREKKIFHGWLLIEAIINYNFIISVLSTNASVNNLRYRVGVEPLVMLVFYAALFYSGQKVFAFILRQVKRKKGSGV